MRPGKTGNLVRSCVTCRRASVTNWRISNPDKWKEIQANHVRKNPEHDRSMSRARTLKKTYGITVDDYNTLLREQNGVCALCHEFVLRANTNFLCVDHNHTTGKVRGLLCYLCNSSIGHFGDDAQQLRAAAEYVETRGV